MVAAVEPNSEPADLGGILLLRKRVGTPNGVMVTGARQHAS